MKNFELKKMGKQEFTDFHENSSQKSNPHTKPTVKQFFTYSTSITRDKARLKMLPICQANVFIKLFAKKKEFSKYFHANQLPPHQIPHADCLLTKNLYIHKFF